MALILLAGVLASAAVPSPTAAEPYEWKKLTVIVGSTPSGGYDQYGRLLARHIGRHLPGNPAVIVSNKPGAGGMIAYNHIYNTAPKDGTEIGISAPGNVIDRLLTGDKSERPLRAGKIHLARRDGEGDRGLHRVAAARGSRLQGILDGQPVELGMVGAGGNSGVYGRALKELLGLQVQAGRRLCRHAAASARLRERRGRRRAGHQLGHAEGDAAALVQLRQGERRSCNTAPSATASLPDVPVVHEILKRDDDRQAMRVFTDAGDDQPAGVRAARSAARTRATALRRAFEAAMRDPELIEEAKKLKLGIDWSTGRGTGRAGAADHPSLGGGGAENPRARRQLDPSCDAAALGRRVFAFVYPARCNKTNDSRGGC